MGNAPLRPILITGGGRRIGLALAHHFLNLRHPVIVSYRTEYPSIEGLRKAGAVCIQADFSTDEGILAFAEKVKSTTTGLRAVLHNASAWQAEKPGTSLSETLSAMLQIHVNAPYLLNHALQDLPAATGMLRATSFTSRIMWWSAAATSTLPMRPVKPRWIT